MFKRISAIALAMALALTALTVAPALAESDMAMIMAKDGIGSYITDAKGMTLYYFVKDAAGVSACSGDCLVKWPPYAAEKVAPQAGLNAKDFGALKRPDGKSQVTFRGFPLYYFFKDMKAGDTNGQGVANVWFVVDPKAFPPMK